MNYKAEQLILKKSFGSSTSRKKHNTGRIGEDGGGFTKNN